MQPLAVATVLLAAAALAIPAAAQTPPSATPSPSTQPALLLPVIGHTTAKRVPCTVLRDLVAPALQAAMHADAQFSKSRKDIAAYSKENVLHGSAPERRMAMVRLDQSVNLMVRDIATISRALGDARVAETQTDPQTHALRVALQQLQSGEEAQLDAVYGVTEKAHFDDIRNDDEDMSNARGAGGMTNPSIPRAIATAEPYETHPTPLPTFGPNGTSPENFGAVATFAPLPGVPPLLLTPETKAREGVAAHTILDVIATCE